MTTVLVLVVVIGIGIGLWGEFSEQHRVGHMAKSFKTQGAGGKKA